MNFEWDEAKDLLNTIKHGVSFYDAQFAFEDPNRVILEDVQHSSNERRFFCIGKIGNGIITVRFTLRSGGIRIIGAGYWRKGRKIYEKENNLHK
jgi:uncharacterized DUF497 family protein